MERQQPPGMVIVGAGHCGGRAAQALRTVGWQGRIDLIGDEPYAPYERPPLSKALLMGAQTAEACFLRSAQAIADDGIKRHIDRVVGIAPEAHQVTLQSGKTLGYQSLLIATGGRASPLDIPGADLPQVRTLRTIDDAQALASCMCAGASLLIIGGGFIGLEVAANALQAGMQVTLLEVGDRLLGRAVPAEIALQVQALHCARGLDLRLGAQATRIDLEPGAGVRVHLVDGNSVCADTVLVGIGMQPAIEFAQAAGLLVRQGIVVDAYLASSVPDVYAAGDVAEFPQALSGRMQRQETWFNAETQAQVAARNMLGAMVAYDAIPWFWSDQFDHQLQVSGVPALGVQAVRRIGTEGDGIVFALDADGRVVGMSAWGQVPRCLKEFKWARMLVERHCQVSASALGDMQLTLKQLLAMGVVST